MSFAELPFPMTLIRKDLISMSIYSIYRITNLVNNKTYIGWTSRDPFIRYKEHQKFKVSKGQHRSLVSYAIEKHGIDNFEFIVLYQSPDYDHSKLMEQHFVTEAQSLVEQWGYNIDRGGNGHKRSASTIEKHRQKMLGRKQSEEHKRKRAMPGDKNPSYGRTGEKAFRYGKHQSEETKHKISESQKED